MDKSVFSYCSNRRHFIQLMQWIHNSSGLDSFDVTFLSSLDIHACNPKSVSRKAGKILKSIKCLFRTEKSCFVAIPMLSRIDPALNETRKLVLSCLPRQQVFPGQLLFQNKTYYIAIDAKFHADFKYLYFYTFILNFSGYSNAKL